MAEPATRVAAIVLNYRTPDLVANGLQALRADVDPARDRIVVVDNGSGDGSVEKIRSTLAERGWRDVEVLALEHNLGFSGGLNAGIRALDAQAYLLLNSDTRVQPGAVDALWRTLQADARIAAASPRLEWPDGSPQISCFRFHTPWSELISASGTGPVRRLLARFDVPLPVRDEAFEPDWTSFAAVLLRAEAIAEIGLLDDGFFMYYEDVDYCRRARQCGWKVRHEPAAHVVHLRGGSSPVKALTAARRRRPRYYYHSRSRYFRKAFGAAGLLAANAAWTLGRSVAWLRETFGRKRPHAVERELVDTWRG